jgi:hypothetical protein
MGRRNSALPHRDLLASCRRRAPRPGTRACSDDDARAAVSSSNLVLRSVALWIAEGRRWYQRAAARAPGDDRPTSRALGIDGGEALRTCRMSGIDHPAETTMDDDESRHRRARAAARLLDEGETSAATGRHPLRPSRSPAPLNVAEIVSAKRRALRRDLVEPFERDGRRGGAGNVLAAVAARAPRRASRARRYARGSACVRTPQQRREEQQRHPRSFRELRDDDHDERRGGGGRADRVSRASGSQKRRPVPARRRRAQCATMLA